jgi:hypothetical protein
MQAARVRHPTRILLDSVAKDMEDKSTSPAPAGSPASRLARGSQAGNIDDEDSSSSGYYW